MDYVGASLDVGTDPKADGVDVPVIVQQDSIDQGRTWFVQFNGDPAPTGMVRGDVRIVVS